MLKRVPILLFIILLFLLYFKETSFDDETIKIGSSLPKNGIIEAWGRSVISGANAYFHYANEQKLLGDKKIDFIVYDDKYEPDLTIDNINKLIYKDNVYALFGLVGTPTVKNILPIVDDEEIPLFAPFSGASFLRNINKNYINLRTSYSNEIETLIEHLTKKREFEKFAVFYQNDDYGEEGYVSLLNSLNKRKMEIAAEGSYKRNTLSINHAFYEIRDAKPQAVIMVGAYKANALFIKKAKADPNFKDTVFCIISFGDANEMIHELNILDTDTSNLIFSQIVPYYNDTSIEVINQYKTLMKKYYPEEKAGFISLEAFLASKVLVTALQNINGNITRNKLLISLRNLPEDTLEGLKIQYKNTALLNKVYLFKYKDNRFKEIR